MSRSLLLGRAEQRRELSPLFYSAVRREGDSSLLLLGRAEERRELSPSLLLGRAEEEGSFSLSSARLCRVGEGSFLPLFNSKQAPFSYSDVPSRRRELSLSVLLGRAE